MMNKYAANYLSLLRAKINKWNPLSLTSSLKEAVPITTLLGAGGSGLNTAIKDFDELERRDSVEYFKKNLVDMAKGGLVGGAAPLVIPSAIHAYSLPRGTSKAYKAFTEEHKLVKQNIENFLKEKFNMPIQTKPQKT